MKVGDTVSLRVRADAGLTEVVGTVLAASADTLTLRRRDGAVVDLAVAQITAGRVVPPSPAQRVAVDELERIAALGWRAPENEPLGDWLLRAGGGLTGRANSVLAVGDPGPPLTDAVAAVQEWYEARGLQPQLQVPAGAAPRGLVTLLDDQGWASSPRTLVMTAELGPVLRGVDESAVAARLDDQPDDAWLAAWRVDAHVDPALARSLMTNHPEVVFASVRDEDHCIAIARGAVDGRWVGLSCVEVAHDRRRNGLGRAVSASVLRASVARGARRAYLQVSEENTAAVTLYQLLGFTVHHEYVYRSRSADVTSKV